MLTGRPDLTATSQAGAQPGLWPGSPHEEGTVPAEDLGHCYSVMWISLQKAT